MQAFQISPERFKVVYQDISEGSEPALRFYLMVTVSTLIASFGLVSNSTAVVIGAMLVAPLMTPIFGISLALVRGETGLLGRALRAEIVGVTAAVAMSFALGLLLGDFEPTSEMLSRTHPNLFDLLVAVLAGFAGAYALVDQKISPALPGVAIATAIVPPLANSGLCLALGEIGAGLGSLLLFLANFLSILVVASLTFLLSGMAKRFGVTEAGVDLVRRFQLPVVAFVLIAGFLGHSLFSIAQERKRARGIEETLIDETSRIPATVLLEVHHYLDDEEGRLHVVAGVSTPAILTPTQVRRMQDQLTEQIGMPTELVVHCLLSSNVSATGSVKNALEQHLDGTFTRTSGSDTLKAIAMTEQIIREHLAGDPVMDLTRVEHVPYGPRSLMVAHVVGIRPLTPEEIERLEAEVRKVTGDDTLTLVVSREERTISTTEGTLRHGWFLGKQGTPENRERLHRIRTYLERLFEDDEEFQLLDVKATRLDGRFHVLLEIAGPEVYPRQRVERLRSQLARELPESVVLYAWSRVDVVHGPDGPTSLTKLNQYLSARQKENLPEEMPLILEASRH
jgi:uncharacterized hydrophobic protein (TIGR00271 family)